jgi:hypothetical protein
MRFKMTGAGDIPRRAANPLCAKKEANMAERGAVIITNTRNRASGAAMQKPEHITARSNKVPYKRRLRVK